MKCDEINLKGTFGIELESIRVAEDGHISKKEHPFNDAHISKDFAECQMELITDTFGSIYEVYSELKRMYRKVEGVLSESDVTREYIWPFSVPPVLVPGESINIAKFEKKDYYREHYRKLLAEKYDKKKMLYCGIHLQKNTIYKIRMKDILSLLPKLPNMHGFRYILWVQARFMIYH